MNSLTPGKHHQMISKCTSVNTPRYRRLVYSIIDLIPYPKGFRVRLQGLRAAVMESVMGIDYVESNLFSANLLCLPTSSPWILQTRLSVTS